MYGTRGRRSDLGRYSPVKNNEEFGHCVNVPGDGPQPLGPGDFVGVMASGMMLVVRVLFLVVVVVFNAVVLSKNPDDSELTRECDAFLTPWIAVYLAVAVFALFFDIIAYKKLDMEFYETNWSLNCYEFHWLFCPIIAHYMIWFWGAVLLSLHHKDMCSDWKYYTFVVEWSLVTVYLAGKTWRLVASTANERANRRRKREGLESIARMNQISLRAPVPNQSIYTGGLDRLQSFTDPNSMSVAHVPSRSDSLRKGEGNPFPSAPIDSGSRDSLLPSSPDLSPPSRGCNLTSEQLVASGLYDKEGRCRTPNCQYGPVGHHPSGAEKPPPAYLQAVNFPGTAPPPQGEFLHQPRVEYREDQRQGGRGAQTPLGGDREEHTALRSGQPVPLGAQRESLRDFLRSDQRVTLPRGAQKETLRDFLQSEQGRESRESLSASEPDMVTPPTSLPGSPNLTSRFFY